MVSILLFWLTTVGETIVRIYGEYFDFEELIYRGEVDKYNDACGEGSITLSDGTEVFGTWFLGMQHGIIIKKRGDVTTVEEIYGEGRAFRRTVITRSEDRFVFVNSMDGYLGLD